ncbi:hypothetical protein TNCV_4923731 [Trichonephila clavipes]|nr:hypothetical protein TNCV_4923731 [Trichonephila clavipes]
MVVHNAAVQRLSPRCLQTRIRPSWCCRQMQNSSVKTTSFHSAAHILLSSHHWWRRRLWFYVIDSVEDIRLSESDCEEFEVSADEINNIPVNPDVYMSLGITQNGYRIIVMFLADL